MLQIQENIAQTLIFGIETLTESEKENLPDESDSLPVVVPLNKTDANTTASSLCASCNWPSNIFCCANEVSLNEVNNTIKNKVACFCKTFTG